MMVSPDKIRDSLLRRIYDINEKDFEGVALDVWKYQYDFNPLYRSYCNLLKINADHVKNIEEVPFLPIVMFREHEIKTGQWEAEQVFRSSGTTSSIQSRHSVHDINHYHAVTEKCFSALSNKPGDFAWIGLLPSYLERSDSSLVNMVHHFMEISNHPENRFFPEVNEEIIDKLGKMRITNTSVILIGVSFALLDLFEHHEVPVWDTLLVIETGGMKGRGIEITREEMYSRLRKGHIRLRIASEYGMTELLSQAYRVDDHFQPGPTMRVLIRDVSDPLRLVKKGQRGVINVIDVANIDTCSFIATDDIGTAFEDGGFDVLGRLDNSDLRGCNLLYV
jgi:acyl-protein synthetase LuxE